MDILARCLINAQIWTDGNPLVARKRITKYVSSSNGFIDKCMEFMGMDSAYILETPIGHPVFSPKTTIKDVQESSVACKMPLQFLRTLEAPTHAFHDCIYTCDRYVVDARKYNSYDGGNNVVDVYVAELQDAAHRKSIKRFRNAFTKANARMYTLNPDEAVSWFDQLLALHMEVQQRNHGEKDHVYLHELLQACARHPNTYWCVVALTNNNTPVAFGIYIMDDATCFTGIDRGVVHKSIFLALVGNSREEGGKICAYHNILLEGVRQSIIKNAVMDLGLSHWSVKKVFEPLVIPQYLAYIGNSVLVDFALRVTNFLQMHGVLKAPLQRK